MSTSTLRPTKIRAALRRRRFEFMVPRTRFEDAPGGIVDFGTAYGGWSMPPGLIEPGWLCYSVGAGDDVSFDLTLIERYGVRVRAFDAVESYVASAARQAGGDPRLSAHHAAIALADGPIRMQTTHDSRSKSVSSANLYDSSDFVELPGRTLQSLMNEFGDRQIDLLKLDVEGAEYDLLEKLDLRALGVKIFAVQLHHTGSVLRARRLIAGLHDAGFETIACRPTVKLTFARREMLHGPPMAAPMPAARHIDAARESLSPRMPQAN
jgi:FkbM family methyltransferase